MTVKELIEKLSEFDSSKNVYFLMTDENPLSEGSAIDDVFEIARSNTPGANAVFICEG